MMSGKHSPGRSCVVLGLAAVSHVGISAALAQLTPTKPGYAVKYQIDGAGVGPIGLVSDSELAAGSYSYDADWNSLLEVKPVALNSGPVGATLYTQTVLDPPATSTYASGFLPTDGNHVLSGQTGWPAGGDGLFPGRLCLTSLDDGSTSLLDVPGNWSATGASGDFYLSAAAGTATGLGDNGYSGIYKVQHGGGTLTGLNLVIDTGAPSGEVADDPAGNVVFSLGGTSMLISGGYNDIYRLSADQVTAGIAAGPTTGIAGSEADLLITGSDLASSSAAFFNSQTPAGGVILPGVANILFDQNADLIVGMNGYIYDGEFSFVGTAGLALILDVTEDAGDFSASVRDMLYTNAGDGAGELAYRCSDTTLWVSADGNVYGINVPEPGALAMFGLAMLGLACRRRYG